LVAFEGISSFEECLGKGIVRGMDMAMKNSIERLFGVKIFRGEVHSRGEVGTGPRKISGDRLLYPNFLSVVLERAVAFAGRGKG
jgi:hypothetical protein